MSLFEGRSAVAMLVSVALALSPVCAAPPTTGECQTLEEQEAWAPACTCWMTLYRDSATRFPAHLLYAAQTAARAGLLSHAAALLEAHRAAVAARPEPTAFDVTELEDNARVRARLDTVPAGQLDVRCARPDAQVVIQGIVVGPCSDGPFDVAAGVYAVAIGGESETPLLTIHAGQTVRYPIRPERQDEKAGHASVGSPAGAEDGQGWGEAYVWTFVGLGTAALGGVVGAIVFEAERDGREEELRRNLHVSSRTEAQWTTYLDEPRAGAFISLSITAAALVGVLAVAALGGTSPGASSTSVHATGVTVTW